LPIGRPNHCSRPDSLGEALVEPFAVMHMIASADAAQRRVGEEMPLHAGEPFDMRHDIVVDRGQYVGAAGIMAAIARGDDAGTVTISTRTGSPSGRRASSQSRVAWSVSRRTTMTSSGSRLCPLQPIQASCKVGWPPVGADQHPDRQGVLRRHCHSTAGIARRCTGISCIRPP